MFEAHDMTKVVDSDPPYKFKNLPAPFHRDCGFAVLLAEKDPVFAGLSI